MPSGIDETAVAAGAYTLHVQVRPIHEIVREVSPPAFVTPVECTVDAQRIVTSVSIWEPLPAPVPARCEYQIIAIPA